jgi:hypothetical protein
MKEKKRLNLLPMVKLLGQLQSRYYLHLMEHMSKQYKKVLQLKKQQ